MFTGREALSSVEQAISQVRSDEGRLDGALSSAMEEAARLRGQEAEGFRVLARVKLDAMMGEEVVKDLNATEQRARAMLERHRSEVEEIARRRAAAQTALEQSETAKHDRNQDLANTLERLDELRHRTAERLKSVPDWQTAQAAVEAAAKIAENADQKAARAEADLAAKGKPYEDDPLFMYLWNKKHGRAEDTSSSLVRFLDGKVARLVGYQDARANYAILREIPLRLREHAKNKQTDVETAKGHLAEIERHALVADGIEALEARVAAARTQVKSAEDAVTKLTDELRQIETDRQKALGSDDEAVHKQAIDLLAEALAREDLRTLYQEAVSTATKEDDQAISSISAARAALAKVDGEVAQIRSEIRETARRRTELEGARDRARSGGYDDPRGTFGGNGREIIGQVIGGILSGVLQGRALDHALRDNHRAPPRRADPNFGDAWNWPSPSSGGGRAGPGASGGDDSGWRTGGSF
jgi:hypothetical protein